MACIGNQGELTESARKMLTALGEPGTAEDVAARAGLPLYRVRGGLREMAEAGLVEQKDGTYLPAQRGLALLSA